MNLAAFQLSLIEGSTASSVVVPLFSGFVGGLVVMLIQNHLRNKKEEKDKRQELKGLIRIVDAEIAENGDLLQKALAVDTASAAGAQLNPILDLRNLQTRDWDNTKVVLARLADEDHFRSLDTLYRRTHDLSTLVQRLYNQSTFHAGPIEYAQDQAKHCREASDLAREKSRKILETL